MRTNSIKITLFAVIILMAGGIFLMNYLQGALRGTTMTLGVDLYPRWVGAQAILEGKSPYSFETRQKIWQAVYGSPDIPNGNPFGFYYPPAITTLFFPFILAGFSLEDTAVIWCALIWALWCAAFGLWSTFIKLPQRTRVLILPLLIISGILYRPAYSNYLLGQYSMLSIIMLVLAWMALKNHKFILAGVFGALCLIKFSITILPCTLLLIIYRREWKFLISFVITSLALYLPPTLILGWWIPDFINDISGYASENAVAWYWSDIKTLSGFGWLLISISILALSLKQRDFDLAIFIALAMNSIFTPHTADYDLVVFIPILSLLVYRLLNNRKITPWLSLSAFTLFIWFPWVSLIYFINQVPIDGVESWYRFIWLVYPLMVLIPVLIYEISTNPSKNELNPINQGQTHP
ncbi:MAG TPA: hypothetical protein DCX53_14545 [Anaerolineae bacterium]|nr:hypothetical protein [Anaerolineae bacterium]